MTRICSSHAMTGPAVRSFLGQQGALRRDAEPGVYDCGTYASRRIEFGAAGPRRGDRALDDANFGTANLHCTVPAGVPLSREIIAALNNAAGQLGEREQLVVQMVYVHGLSFGEAARALGMTPSQAKWIHDAAVGKLLRRPVSDAVARRFLLVA